MATIDLGKIKLKWRGTYAGGTAYVPDDVVEYTDGSVTSSYICVTASTGNAPSSGGSAHSSWNYMAKGQASSPTTTQGDIIVRGASADGRLAIGSAGQVLKVNSSGNGLEYGAGFEGNYYLAYANQYQHGNTVNVNGSGLSNGTADGQRDCILLNNGLYHTVTPGHIDDIIVISCSANVYSNWGVAGTYWGLGFQHSTSTNFANNRNTFYLMGQHCQGNGGAGGDEYRNTNTFQQYDVSDIGMSVGTTYYVRHIGQVHSPNNGVAFGQSNGTQSRSRHTCLLRHYKKQT
mgnify:FL=1